MDNIESAVFRRVFGMWTLFICTKRQCYPTGSISKVYFVTYSDDCFKT